MLNAYYFNSRTGFVRMYNTLLTSRPVRFLMHEIYDAFHENDKHTNVNYSPAKFTFLEYYQSLSQVFINTAGHPQNVTNIRY